MEIEVTSSASTENAVFEISNVIDLRICKKGDILISRQGTKLKYFRPLNSEIDYYDHEVEYLDKNRGNGTRTHDGHVFRNNRNENDEDIVKIIPVSWISFEDELPEYYKVVTIKLNNGKSVNAWRATDGEEMIYTVFKKNIVLRNDEIVKWKYNPKFDY
jgi:hypothetical protein